MAGSRPAGCGGVLPHDALYEILLRLPAKDLCRLRAVCRPWRSLLSDPHFIAAHATRHPGPLIVAGYDPATYHRDHRNEGILCDIMDLAGRVVKRVRVAGKERVVSIQLDRICTAEGMGPCYQLLNPATGAMCALPEGFMDEGARRRSIFDYKMFVSFGQIASTGEYKVLRVLGSYFYYDPMHPMQLCEVFTLDCRSQWTVKKAPAPSEMVRLGLFQSVVIDGIVYFFSYEPGCIASFDLEAERWRQDLQGPLSAGVSSNNVDWSGLSMVTLSGCLVVVHHTQASSMDLWFPMDIEKGLWVKQHSIQINVQRARYKVNPLLVLDDGRIVLIYIGGNGLIRIYNPRTNTFTDMAEMGHCVAVGLYTGSLLSLATDAS